MRRVVQLGCATVFSLFVFSETAVADEPEPEQREPVWSVGAGIGFGSTVYYSFGPAYPGIGGIGFGGYQSAPHGQVLVERKLSPSFSLMLELSMHYTKMNTRWDNADLNGSSKGVGATAGVRWIVNPGGLVEVSPYLALQGHWSWGDGTDFNGGVEWDWNDFGYDLGVAAGLVLERELIDDLYLRVESSVARVSYYRRETEEEGVLVATHNSVSAGLDLRPSVQLRLLF